MLRLKQGEMLIKTAKTIKTEIGQIDTKSGLGIWKEIDSYSKRYNVVHLQSGLKLVDFATNQQARYFLEQIRFITDWTQSHNTLMIEYKHFGNEFQKAKYQAFMKVN